MLSLDSECTKFDYPMQSLSQNIIKLQNYQLLKNNTQNTSRNLPKTASRTPTALKNLRQFYFHARTSRYQHNITCIHAIFLKLKHKQALFLSIRYIELSIIYSCSPACPFTIQFKQQQEWKNVRQERDFFVLKFFFFEYLFYFQFLSVYKVMKKKIFPISYFMWHKQSYHKFAFISKIK